MESHQYFTGSYKKGCIMQKFPFLIYILRHLLMKLLVLRNQFKKLNLSMALHTPFHMMNIEIHVRISFGGKLLFNEIIFALVALCSYFRKSKR